MFTKLFLLKNQTVFVSAKMFSGGRRVELVILCLGGERDRTVTEYSKKESRKLDPQGGEVQEKLQNSLQ